ncbi:MAG: MFS transporter [Mycobacteriales bacterium]
MHVSPNGPVSSPVRVALTAATGFFVMGVLVSVLGPTLPELRSRHDLGGTGAALLLAASSIGTVGGIVLAGRYRHRVPVERLLSLGALAMAIGCGGVPVAPNGGALAATLLVAGFGLGVLDILLNLLLANGFGSSGGAVLSAVSATFGVSAVLTPLLVGRAPDELALPYLLCAGGSVALLALTTTMRAVPTTAPEGRRASAHELPLIVLLSALFLGYIAFESGAASWETTHLRAVTDLSDSATANAVALFWLGLTVGRLVTVPLALRWHPGRLVLTSLALGTVTVAFAAHPPYAVAAYALTGLVIAPVFPAVITWHARAVPSGRGATRMFALGLAGPTIGAPILGVTTDRAGAEAVPWVLAAFAIATTAISLACYRRTTRGTPADGPPVGAAP